MFDFLRLMLLVKKIGMNEIKPTCSFSLLQSFGGGGDDDVIAFFVVVIICSVLLLLLLQMSS